MPDSIGPFQFITLTGNPSSVRQHVLVEERPGVDGVALWKGGIRGVLFTLRSTVDAISVAYGRLVFGQYVQLIDANPVVLVWAGLNMTSSQYLFQVMDVRQVDLVYSPMATPGFLPSGSKAILTCEWDLLPIKIE